MSYESTRTELTNFDKLAVWTCTLGAGVMTALYFVAVEGARTVYSDIDDLIPGITKVMMSPGYTAAAVMLMLFLAYYGTRMRRLYDNKVASNVLFLGMMVAIAANSMLIWALYSPASRSMQYLG